MKADWMGLSVGRRLRLTLSFLLGHRVYLMQTPYGVASLVIPRPRSDEEEKRMEEKRMVAGFERIIHAAEVWR